MDGKTLKVDRKLTRSLTNGRPGHDEWQKGAMKTCFKKFKSGFQEK